MLPAPRCLHPDLRPYTPCSVRVPLPPSFEQRGCRQSDPDLPTCIVRPAGRLHGVNVHLGSDETSSEVRARMGARGGGRGGRSPCPGAPRSSPSTARCEGSGRRRKRAPSGSRALSSAAGPGPPRFPRRGCGSRARHCPGPPAGPSRTGLGAAATPGRRVRAGADSGQGGRGTRRRKEKGTREKEREKGGEKKEDQFKKKEERMKER